MALRNILLLTNDPATANSVTAALNSNGKLASNDICRDITELTLRLKDGLAPAVLIDIDGQPQRLLAAMEPLARKFSETQFIVISGEMRNDLLLEAMQVGARHFILKQSVPADLNDVLHRVCKDTNSDAGGTAVTILSAGGGCGATTVAVNLASEMHDADPDGSGHPALVVDLDPSYGAVATYLGVDSQYGIFDLMNRTGQLDDQAPISSTAVAASENLHALLSLPRNRLGEAVAIEPQRLGQAIDCCRRSYRLTVIDAPRLPWASAAELARHSTATILLMQLTVKDIRVARQMLTGLAENGVSVDTIIPIANRYRRRSRLVSLSEAEKTLGLGSGVLGSLANDFDAVTEAVNLGKSLTQAAPRSEFRRDLQKLAARIAAPIESPVLQKAS